jgi:hypothetical protein
MSLQEMIEEAQNLSVDERKQLIKALIDMMPGSPIKKRSLRELRGLGKEIWAGVDAQVYINQQRDEWDQHS